MTSPLPPRLRDTRSSADLIRQLKQNGRQVDHGLLGGRWSPAKPLGAAAREGDLEDDDPLDDDLMAAQNSDVAYAATAGQVTLNLTYVPIEGSLLVFWDGDDLAPAEYVLADQRVIFTDPHIHVGDRLHAVYWYWPNDEPGLPGPASVSLRGITDASGSNGPALSNLALPTGTAVGDLIVVSAGGNGTAALAFTDARLTAVGTNMWIGFATNLSPVAVTASGAFGAHWSIACMTLITNATGWTAPALTSSGSLVDGATMAVGAVSGVSAAVCALHDGHSTVSGRTDMPVGYTNVGAASITSLDHARVDFWVDPSIGTSPTGPTTFHGGPGGAEAAVVGLIGPTL